MIYDTPGVIPYGESDHYKQVLIGSITFDKDKYPEDTVLTLIEELNGIIENKYGSRKKLLIQKIL